MLFHRLFTSLLFSCLFIVAAGCGDTPSEPTPPDDQTPGGDTGESDKYGVDPNFDPTQLPTGSATEDWGIGDKWYDYNFNKHSLTPRDQSWVVRYDDDAAYHFRVIRYYDDDGQSGAPSMEIRSWENGAFGDARKWQAERKIVEGFLCLDFDTATSVDCNGPHHIIWRTDRRPVPEVGFAVNNPAFYVVREPGVRVFQIPGTTPPATLPSIEDSIPSSECATETIILDDNTQDTDEDRNPDCDTKPLRVQSVFDNDSSPLIPLEALVHGKSIFQITGTLHLAQWTADLDEDNDVLTVFARCKPAEYSVACTGELTDEPQQIDIPLDKEAGKKWTFVDLCGPRGSDDDDTPFVPTMTQTDSLKTGQWPDNDTFELLVERDEGYLKVWVSPSQPIAFGDDNRFDNTRAPISLWSIPGSETCD